ncbi:MAG: hypothetical protein IKF78_08375 [Atopobiaceae bacterium]|nr:hypothetical protein [Atopobiaceae bacterium]
MWKRLKAWRDKIQALLDANDPATDWEAVRSEHLVQISIFQHERLIHLLVTLAFALMELVSAVVTILFTQLFTAALSFLFLVLLVPYIVHYYHLENGTQALYAQYDELARRADGYKGDSPLCTQNGV